MWLGIAKYLLKDVMPQMSAIQKKEIRARIRAFHTSGFKVKLYGNVCAYYNSFLGRDFKAWSQMALFIMGPYLTSGQLLVLSSFSKVNRMCSYICRNDYILFYRYFRCVLVMPMIHHWKMIYNNLQQKCQDFFDNVKTHMPMFLQKQKTHLILHLVECMMSSVQLLLSMQKGMCQCHILLLMNHHPSPTISPWL